MLGEPEERLFVELVPNGGAFGGKEDMTIQAQTALLARLTGRPVRLELSREQSIRMHPKRHPHHHELHGRLRRGGPAHRGEDRHSRRLRAPTPRSAARCSSAPPATPAGPTGCRRVEVEAIAAYTNNPPCGAMRGFGVNQTSFAMEGCLDLLAAKVGLDGWEMRWRNVVRVGDLHDDRTGAREVGRAREDPARGERRPTTLRAPRGARSASPAR